MGLFDNLTQRIKRIKDMEEEYFLVRALDGEINAMQPISEKDYYLLSDKLRLVKAKFKRYKTSKNTFIIKYKDKKK